MLFRNREWKWELVFHLVILVIAATTACFFGTACVITASAVCVVLGAVHYAYAFFRTRRLRKLSEDLDCLLLKGTLLPIQDYSEGEISILGNQIQKLSLRLMESTNRLQSEKEYLADALADISHQLRTPLTAMNLTAAMLSSGDLEDDRRRELTAELKRLLSRTEWLVESLLKLSKLDAGTVRLRREPVAVSCLIAKAAAPMSIPMDLKEQQLVVDCGMAQANVDLIWTAEAIGNLLKNCVEHTPPGGSVSIVAEETALYTSITVTDTGPGFAQEDIPRLFERFYKGKNASENSYGIGLALARTIITAQNGTIQASNSDTGAQFVVKFYKQVI